MVLISAQALQHSCFLPQITADPPPYPSSSFVTRKQEACIPFPSPKVSNSALSQEHKTENIMEQIIKNSKKAIEIWKEQNEKPQSYPRQGVLCHL